MERNLYFEDLEVGRRFVTDGRTITEADIAGFAELSGDFNAIHLNPEYAATGVFGRRVAHGLLSVSIATGLLDALGVFQTSMGAMLGIDNWRFLTPVFIGDTIHLEMTIEFLRLTSTRDHGVVKRRMQLVNQGAAVVQDGHITSLIRCRPDEESCVPHS